MDKGQTPEPRIIGLLLFCVCVIHAHMHMCVYFKKSWDLKEVLYVLIVYTAIRIASHRAMIEKCPLIE